MTRASKSKPDKSPPSAPLTDAEKAQGFKDLGKIVGTVQARLEFAHAMLR
jgi:hypothetical protein